LRLTVAAGTQAEQVHEFATSIVRVGSGEGCSLRLNLGDVQPDT
jgi:hypothetical protein